MLKNKNGFYTIVFLGEETGIIQLRKTSLAILIEEYGLNAGLLKHAENKMWCYLKI